MKYRRVGVIDVGSNSVRLLVAGAEDGGIRTLCSRRITTRMMLGVKNGNLTEDAIQTNARAIAELAASAREAGAEAVFAFGTSALRDSANREALSDRTEALCGIRVALMSGEEEAQLAYGGCAPEGRCGIIDIGGGSSELLVGADGKVLYADSARIGAIRLMDMMGGNDRDPERLVETALAIVGPVAQGAKGLPVDRWIGEGGSITTLAAICWQVDKYAPDAIENCPLTRGWVEEWLCRLCAMPMEERLRLPGLPAHRADAIPFGAAILAAEMRATGAPVVYATDHDNLEGYIRLYLQEV